MKQLETANKYLVIDLGATNLRLAVYDAGRLSQKIILQTPKTLPKLETLLERSIKKLLEKQGAKPSCIAISAAGPVKNGLVYLTNITANYVDIKTKLEKTFALPVEIVNDAAAAVLAEKELRNQKVSSIVYITFSTGIGGGVIKNGQLVWFNRVKDEIGHMKIDSDYGSMCKCGGMGHWENFSSGRSLPNFFLKWAKKNKKKVGLRRFDDAARMFERFRAGDKMSVEFFEEVARLNAKAIDLVVEKYSPELIVFGGSVARNNKELRSGIEKKRKSRVPIMLTKHGDDISLLGAGLYLNQKSLTRG